LRKDEIMNQKSKVYEGKIMLFLILLAISSTILILFAVSTNVFADGIDNQELVGYPAPAPDPEFDIGYPIYWYGYPAPGYPAPEVYEEVPGYPAPEIEETVVGNIDEKIIENTKPGEDNNSKNKSVENQKLWKQELNRIEIAFVEELKKVGNKILFWLK